MNFFDKAYAWLFSLVARLNRSVLQKDVDKLVVKDLKRGAKK